MSIVITPSDVILILPVSSETIIVIASYLSEAPIAALCLVPKNVGISYLSVVGKYAPAQTNLFL